MATMLVLPGAGQQRDKPKLAKPGDPSPPAFSEICIVSAKRILAAEGSDRQTGRQIRPSEKGRNVMHLTLCRAQTG